MPYKHWLSDFIKWEPAVQRSRSGDSRVGAQKESDDGDDDDEDVDLSVFQKFVFTAPNPMLLPEIPQNVSNALYFIL